jgi:hypothetical protein
MTERSDYTVRCLHLTDSADDCISLGRAANAGPPYHEGVYWYKADEKLADLTSRDARNVCEVPCAFGSTTQGDALHDITEEIADRLRVLNAEKAAAKAARKLAEHAREKALDGLIASIPQDVQAEQRRLMREYQSGMLEGSDGYNPYSGWLAHSSLTLLRKRCPDIARQIETLAKSDD